MAGAQVKGGRGRPSRGAMVLVTGGVCRLYFMKALVGCSLPGGEGGPTGWGDGGAVWRSETTDVPSHGKFLLRLYYPGI